jgi:hypothetical protein
MIHFWTTIRTHKFSKNSIQLEFYDLLNKYRITRTNIFAFNSLNYLE